MKLLRVGPNGEERPCVLIDDGLSVLNNDSLVVDLSSHIRDYDAGFFASAGIQRIATAVSATIKSARPLAGERIGAPIARPGKIVCIDLNYADHGAESETESPTEPVVCFKAPDTVVGPYDDVLIPIGSEKTDWEVELGVVIGSRARYLSSIKAAADSVAGYILSNDVSERAFQLERGGQWVKGKSCETFNPLGPWLVTTDEVADPQRLRLWLKVNGEPMQDGSTAQMLFGVHYLIWYLSQFMVLEPGDLINTGTPAGVGLGMDPPRYLRSGDVMELGIHGLGWQCQTCRQAVGPTEVATEESWTQQKDTP